jgi:TPR repeat protein
MALAFEEAVALQQKGAVAGHADSQYNLGRLLAKGDARDNDAFRSKVEEEAAACWFRKAADQGHAAACGEL